MLMRFSHRYWKMYWNYNQGSCILLISNEGFKYHIFFCLQLAHSHLVWKINISLTLTYQDPSQAFIGLDLTTMTHGVRIFTPWTIKNLFRLR